MKCQKSYEFWRKIVFLIICTPKVLSKSRNFWLFKTLSIFSQRLNEINRSTYNIWAHRVNMNNVYIPVSPHYDTRRCWYKALLVTVLMRMEFVLVTHIKCVDLLTTPSDLLSATSVTQSLALLKTSVLSLVKQSLTLFQCLFRYHICGAYWPFKLA